MYRQSGPIPEIKQEKYPKRLVVFDTEAWRGPMVEGVEVQTLRLGVARFLELSRDLEVLQDHWYDFTTGGELGDFLEYMARKDRVLYVYAHNIKYDLQLSGVLTDLISRGWRAGLFVIEDPPTFIRLKRGRFSIMFVDTFNYWQYGVQAMGDQIGISKLTMPPQDAPTPEWVTYCKRDVEVLTSYLLEFMTFLSDNDLCGLGLTLASQAFRTYRHRFMRHEIILHNRPEVLQLERDGYFGGRTEAFFIGEAPPQDYYKLDVNSMYPFVMRSHPYPVELVGYSENVPVDRLKWLSGVYYCLADVDLEASRPAYPFSNGVKLLFPVGRFRTVLHHPELVHALEAGEVRTCHRVAIYHTEDIFTDYVDFFYGLKVQAEADGNKVLRKQAKIFLNALYGKFGQREVVSKITPYDGPERYDRLTGYSQSLGQTVEVNYLGNSVEVRYKGGESYYSSPVVAGAVTAYARLYLWDLITLTGDGNAYYCDTDSLIVTKAGYDNSREYINESILGKLKVEGIQSTLVLHSVKDYVYGHEVKVKGVPKSAKLVSEGVWSYDQFRGGKTWVKDGMPVGAAVYSRTKQRKSAYDKGIVTPTGWVLPLPLDLWGNGEG